MPSAIVSRTGLITIPVEVRRGLNVATGNRLDFIEIGSGAFVLRAAKVDIKTLRGVVRKPARPVSVLAMNRAVRGRAVSRATGKSILSG
jgi:antitoxin PrlF